MDFHRPITGVNHFAERLRYARTHRGFSQAALAKACGLSQSAIANYENETRRSTKNIFRLAEVLRVDPVWLGTGVGEMARDPTSTGTPKLLAETYGGVSWPFERIEPEQFWSLPSKERVIIEKAVAALIGILHDAGEP